MLREVSNLIRDMILLDTVTYELHQQVDDLTVQASVRIQLWRVGDFVVISNVSDPKFNYL